MTLKLAKHIEDKDTLHEQAISELGKWLYEYSDAFDTNSPHPNDAEKLANDMINEAYSCIPVKKEELHKLMEAAYREGWAKGQGDHTEGRDPGAAWKTSNTLKALIDDAP